MDRKDQLVTLRSHEPHAEIEELQLEFVGIKRSPIRVASLVSSRGCFPWVEASLPLRSHVARDLDLLGEWSLVEDVSPSPPEMAALARTKDLADDSTETDSAEESSRRGGDGHELQQREEAPPTPRLLTDRVVNVQAQASQCGTCDEDYTSQTASLMGSSRRFRCGCCKRQLKEKAFTPSQTQSGRGRRRCLDCVNAGAGPLEAMRKERAEAAKQATAKQATAKRKATVARKKQEREQNEEEERQLDLSSDDVEAELTAQQKRRHKLKERNFATFSRFILEGFGVDEDRGTDPLRRLREDRKRLQSRHTRDRGDSSDESSEEAKPRRQKRRKSRVLEASSSGSEDRKSVKRTLKKAPFASKRKSGKAKKQEKPSRGETANDVIVIDDSEEEHRFEEVGLFPFGS